MDDLEPVTAPYLEGYLVSYRKALVERRLSPDSQALQTLMRNDVYELEPDLHVRLIQERWRDFVRDHQEDRKVFLFECSFIQNPVTALKVRHDAPDEMTAAHVRELLRIISPFEPVLLYLDQKDIRTSFLHAVDERPHAWYEGFESYYTCQGYGLAHGLKGTEGVLRVLEERSRLEKSILSTLQAPCHLVDNSGFSPSTLRETLTEILTRRGILGIFHLR